MTQYLGLLAVALAIPVAPPKQLPPSQLVNQPLKRLWLDRVQIDGTAAGGLIGDTIILADLDLDTILNPDLSKIYYDAAGTSVTLKVGDANNDAALIAASSIASAGSKSLMQTPDISVYANPLWKILGYATRDAAYQASAAADRPGKLRIYATIGGANMANVTDLVWAFYGC